MNPSMQSVAKRSPRSHPIHVTPHLSTIEEGDVDMAEQTAGSELQDQPACDAQTDQGVRAAVGVPEVEPRLPLPDDLQQAEALQVSFDLLSEASLWQSMSTIYKT